MRRLMDFETIIVELPHLKIQDTELMDVMYYNPKKNQLFFERDIDSVDNANIPVGIVVSPASHNIYSNGMPAVMSLKNIETVKGEGFTDFPNSLYRKLTGTWLISADGTVTDEMVKNTGSYCYLPFYTTSPWYTDVSPENSNLKYSTTKRWLPSPFLEDWSKNPKYGQPNSTSPDVFNVGANYAHDLFKYATYDRKNAWKETLEYDETTSPTPFYKSWLYTTPGTYNGEWYVPGMYELGYAMCLNQKIAEVFNKLNAKWSGSCDLFTASTNRYYISAIYTNYSDYFGIDTDGYCNVVKDGEHNLRPFYFINPDKIDKGELMPSNKRGIVDPHLPDDKYSDSNVFTSGYLKIHKMNTFNGPYPEIPSAADRSDAAFAPWLEMESVVSGYNFDEKQTIKPGKIDVSVGILDYEDRIIPGYYYPNSTEGVVERTQTIINIGESYTIYAYPNNGSTSNEYSIFALCKFQTDVNDIGHFLAANVTRTPDVTFPNDEFFTNVTYAGFYTRLNTRWPSMVGAGTFLNVPTNQSLLTELENFTTLTISFANPDDPKIVEWKIKHSNKTKWTFKN